LASMMIPSMASSRGLAQRFVRNGDLRVDRTCGWPPEFDAGCATK
jgi:hypothetical protein